jgi:glycosyltransferase involved in cell wall biosynthesis
MIFTGTPEARVLETFLAGLGLAIERGTLRPDSIRIEFIGSTSVECIALFTKWSGHPGREGIVDHIGFRPRAEVLRILARSDAALVLLGDYPGIDLIIPVKVYEAIGLDRPVFAMTPRGDLRDVLEGLGWGVVVEPRPEAVAEGLGRLVSSPPATRRVDPSGRYDRAKLADEVVRILDAVYTEWRHSRTDGR